MRANDMADSLVETLKRNLIDLGWRTGDTLDVDERQAGGDAALLPRLATEIVAQRPDVIACTGGTEAQALQSATREIPIVFFQVAVDPVSVGLVESISRPGGNVTGIMQAPQLLSSKRLSILTELLGRRPLRLAYIVNPGNVNGARLWTDAAEAANNIGAEIDRVDVNTPLALEGVFAGLKDRDALLVQYDFLLVSLRSQIADLAARRRRRSCMITKPMSWWVVSPPTAQTFARTIARAQSISIGFSEGAHPRDLPVVQGSRLELVLNVATAKALGLTIPPTLLARAEEAIEYVGPFEPQVPALHWMSSG